jgi:hypothetical protein
LEESPLTLHEAQQIFFSAFYVSARSSKKKILDKYKESIYSQSNIKHYEQAEMLTKSPNTSLEILSPRKLNSIITDVLCACLKFRKIKVPNENSNFMVIRI